MAVKIDDRTPQIKNTERQKLSLITRLMIEDIHRKSVSKTPMREGALRAMVAKQINGATGIIEWRAPYAEYQERGYTTGPVRHYTTPGTQAHFAEESVEDVMNNIQEYVTRVGLE